MADNNSPDYKTLFCRRKRDAKRLRSDRSRKKKGGSRLKSDRSNFKSSADRPLSLLSYAIPMTCSPDR
jgi:hypothetical protein